MRSVVRFQVFPLYHQMEIRDGTDDVDYPQWERGDEAVLTSAQCIVVATRSDLDGPVDVEVWLGAEPTDRPPGHLLFDGELLTTGHGALIGNSLAGELRRFTLPIGWHSIRIYTDRPTNPGRFTVLFAHEVDC
jgi:hypothetical protein